jgi:hypothetical protein
MFRVHRVFRWVAGLIAMIAFSPSTLEVLFPDVHDGDAQSTLMFGATHANEGAPTVPQDLSSGPHHAPHVDHCSHGHVATVSSGISIDDAPSVMRRFLIDPTQG